LTGETRAGRHDRVARRLFVGDMIRNAGKLLLHDGCKFGHLLFHFPHLFAHVQNDFDPREIYAHVPRKREDHVQALQILIRVQPRVALGTRWLQQSDAFIEAQRLRMQFIKLSHGADHVAGFGASFSSRGHRQTPAFENKSLRGSSGATVSSSFMMLRTRSSVGFGTITWISTYWSPRAPLRALGTPFSRSRSVLPLLVAGGMRTRDRPSIVGTSTFAPRVASLTVTGTLVYKSFPRRSKNGCGRTSTSK